MFQFPAFASVQSTDDGIAPAGLPHSDIRGLMDICSFPRLFAACHVLLRLREPQASPMRPSLAFLFLSLPLTGRPACVALAARPLAGTRARLLLLRLSPRLYAAASSLLFHHVYDLCLFVLVVPGRVELPTSTLSV